MCVTSIKTVSYQPLILSILCIKQVLHVLTSIWVLCTSNAGWNLIFHIFHTWNSFLTFFVQKTWRNHILTTIWSVQHPNTGQNIQKQTKYVCLTGPSSWPLTPLATPSFTLKPSKGPKILAGPIFLKNLFTGSIVSFALKSFFYNASMGFGLSTESRVPNLYFISKVPNGALFF